MEPVEIHVWHFVVAAFVFALGGVIAHTLRGLVNLYPDKISDTPMVNIVLSQDYSGLDHITRTEFDDFGYYRFDSLHNLKLSVFFWLAGGLGFMAFSDQGGQAFASLIELGLSGFVDLFWYRIEQLRG